jgi:hypothetical protein
LGEPGIFPERDLAQQSGARHESDDVLTSLFLWPLT